MGTALLILVEFFIWGLVLVMIGAAIETLWSRIRGRNRDTLVE
ncbi:MAG TPA: hypothetical protein VJU60_12315 [Thermoleophilaceae bacterium]|nr:hypothetical protein [Thermoleophilaceae bacterium]